MKNLSQAQCILIIHNIEDCDYSGSNCYNWSSVHPIKLYGLFCFYLLPPLKS